MQATALLGDREFQFVVRLAPRPVPHRRPSLRWGSPLTLLKFPRIHQTRWS